MTLSVSARADEKTASVEGAWKQVEQKNGGAEVYQKFPDGMDMTDCIVDGRFIWTIVQNGKVLGVAGGRYKWEKDKFSEIIEYVSGQGIPESFVGSTFEFSVKVDGDAMTKVGTIQVNGQDYKIDEKWERCKPCGLPVMGSPGLRKTGPLRLRRSCLPGLVSRI
jgi:hypothetical protein